MAGSGDQDPGSAGGKNDDVRRQSLMPSVGKRRPRRLTGPYPSRSLQLGARFSDPPHLACLLPSSKSSGLAVPMCWCRPQLAHKESRFEALVRAVGLSADRRHTRRANQALYILGRRLWDLLALKRLLGISENALFKQCILAQCVLDIQYL